MILIVGGAGYIGSHTNKLMSQRGYETVVFDNLVYGHRDAARWGKFVLGDLANKDQIRSCLEGHRIDAVMHFSAFAYVGESMTKPALYYQNNVVNAINLLDVMREFDVRYFIFSSSCATYGMPRQVPVTEDHPQEPINPYGRTKLMVEKILEDYGHAYGMKHISLRYFNAAGADPEAEIGERHEPETHLIPLALYAALGRTPGISIYGTDYPTDDGTCIRDYIHVNDLADAHIKALEYLRDSGQSAAFNLGNDTGYSVRSVIDHVRRVSQKDFTVVEKKRRPGDPPVLISSSSRAASTLGWRPQFPDIDSIIETAWNWHCREDNSSAEST
ncbi:MAG: UDP-glucose 4-epimerase GalE [Gammaproteobacteria bacterium]|jgi:UDP-glucose 4-epimerase